MELLGEFYNLKLQYLENEEHIIKDIEGRTIEEKTTNVINWFIHNEIPDKPRSPTSFDSKAEKAVKRTKPQKEASKRNWVYTRRR